MPISIDDLAMGQIIMDHYNHPIYKFKPKKNQNLFMLKVKIVLMIFIFI